MTLHTMKQTRKRRAHHMSRSSRWPGDGTCGGQAQHPGPRGPPRTDTACATHVYVSPTLLKHPAAQNLPSCLSLIIGGVRNKMGAARPIWREFLAGHWPFDETNHVTDDDAATSFTHTYSHPTRSPSAHAGAQGRRQGAHACGPGGSCPRWRRQTRRGSCPYESCAGTSRWA